MTGLLPESLHVKPFKPLVFNFTHFWLGMISQHTFPADKIADAGGICHLLLPSQYRFKLFMFFVTVVCLKVSNIAPAIPTNSHNCLIKLFLRWPFQCVNPSFSQMLMHPEICCSPVHVPKPSRLEMCFDLSNLSGTFRYCDDWGIYGRISDVFCREMNILMNR